MKLRLYALALMLGFLLGLLLGIASATAGCTDPWASEAPL